MGTNSGPWAKMTIHHSIIHKQAFFFFVLKLTSTKCGLKEEMKNLPSEGQAINREVIHVWEQMKLTLQSDKQGWPVHQKNLLGNAWRSLVSQTSRIQASVLPTQSSPVWVSYSQNTEEQKQVHLLLLIMRPKDKADLKTENNRGPVSWGLQTTDLQYTSSFV